MEYILIIISAIFVNNILLSQFLGVCPVLGVSNKLSTATGMSMAVCFVITLATVVTYLLNMLLVNFGLAMVLFAGLREQLALNNVPKAFKGIPIALITASLLAMAFMGFSGLV